MSIYRRCREVVLEALAITLTFTLIFFFGAGSGWAVAWFGEFTHSDLTLLAKSIKFIIFFFDALAVLLLSAFVLRRHYFELRSSPQ